jgi:hypothetical protein
MEMGNESDIVLWQFQKDMQQLKRQCEESAAVIEKAKALLTELKPYVSSHTAHCKLAWDRIGERNGKERLKRIDEILNWKGDE